MAQKMGRFRRQRRLLVELPGLGKPGALERRPYPPGDHGMKRRKYSEYGLRLEEKQKVLAHYGLHEKQLRRFIRQAKRGQTNWTEKVISMLESRLDNIVFRLGYAPSMMSAKQWISHGHVFVNGKKMTISSALLKVGDRVQLSEKMFNNEQCMASRQSPRLELADFLAKEDDGGKEVGVLKSIPLAADIPFPFQANYFTEYYSTRM